MDSPLRILHLEDEPDFCELAKALLEKEGLTADVEVVSNLEDFIAACERRSFDVVLADYKLPTCTGIQALAEARQRCPDTPFILVSGTVGEQAAIEALKRGATDYVLKQWVERLGPAVRRAVEEAAERARRRRIEVELSRRESYFRALTENSLDVISILDRDGVFQFNSASLKHVLGYEPVELAGQNAFAFVHPEDVGRAREAFERALRNPKIRVRAEFRFRHRSGGWSDLEVIGQHRPDEPEIGGLVLNARDVAARRQAEKELRESEGRYRSLFENMLGGAAYCRMLFEGKRPKDFVYLGVNRTFEKLTGLKDVIGKKATEVLPGIQESNPELFEIYGRVALTGRSERFEVYVEALQAWLSVAAYSPEPGYFVAAFDDITERRAIEEGQRRLAAAVEQAVETIVITDVQGTILYVNPAFEKITGYTREEALGLNPRILKSGRHDEAFYRHMWNTLLKGEVWHGRMTNQRKDGTLYEEDASIAPIREPAGKVINYVAVKRDVSREVQLEEQLRQAQKMEAIGQLAGGVAHDLNNMLGVIRGNAELLMMDEKQLGAESGQCLRHVIDASERAANLTRQLLIFSRKQVLQAQPVLLDELVGNLARMLRRILREDIRLDCRYAEHLPPVQADAGMMEQVLLNLVVNARDAMPRGGQLMIATERVSLDETCVQVNPEARAGKFVRLAVSDTGTGIAPELLPRIFEPFFTTKEVGKGTGLGLATVYGTVKQHHGWIEVSSQVGKGTTFNIFLPAISRTAAKATNAKAKVEFRGGNETILLVEDDEAVRMTTQRVLEHQGYRIYEAARAREARALWRKHRRKIVLLLTDIVMPEGVTGRDLAEELRKDQPKLKVIFMSGYSADIVGKGTEFFRRTKSHFLHKPCPTETLIQTVRRTLDEK